MPVSCNDCPLRSTCAEICEAVRVQLPGEDHGRAHALHRRNAANAARRLHAEISAARALTDFRHLLRGRMREVFDLVYNEALPQEEIARRLGIGRRVVSHYLMRAPAANFGALVGAIGIELERIRRRDEACAGTARCRPIIRKRRFMEKSPRPCGRAPA